MIVGGVTQRDPADRRDAAVRLLRRLVDPRELRAARAAAAGLRPRAPAGGGRRGGCDERARSSACSALVLVLFGCSCVHVALDGVRGRGAARQPEQPPHRCSRSSGSSAGIDPRRRRHGARRRPARCRASATAPLSDRRAVRPRRRLHVARPRAHGPRGLLQRPADRPSRDAIGALDRLLGPQDVGDDLRTTLDPRPSRSPTRRSAAGTGAVVALDVKTGAVRVMAANAVVSTRRRLRAERRTDASTARPRAGFPPGSTLKVVTATAALDTGRYHARLDGQRRERQGDLRHAAGQLRRRGLRRHRPHDGAHELGQHRWAQVGEKLGKRARWPSTWSSFGFYEDPPHRLPGRADGAERRVRRRRAAAVADLGARSTSAAWRSGRTSCSSRRCRWRRSRRRSANGGMRMEPRLVAEGRRSRRAHGRRAAARGGRARHVARRRRASSPTMMQQRRRARARARRRALEGVEVAGKTGTAELGDGTQRRLVHRLHRQGRGRRDGRAPDRAARAAPSPRRSPPQVLEALGRADAERSTATRSSTAATGCSSRLGSGGMADVYCAEDQQLGRRVALKLLYRRFAEDEQFVERFRREASSAAGLQHPNIVGDLRPRRVGRHLLHRDGVPRGPHAQGAHPRARRRRRPRRRSTSSLQILRAARFAHQRGIVHRDIKPHNVMIDDEGRVKVTDFGIARAGASDMTETGSIMGTAQYLSPEQAQGQPVDARSDLYSIGIVLYEMLTGARAVRRRVAGRGRAQAGVRGAGAAARAQPGGPAGARRGRAARAGEGPGAPLRRRRRVHRRAAGARVAPSRTVVALAAPPGRGDAVEEDDRGAPRRWWLWLLAPARAGGDRVRRSTCCSRPSRLAGARTWSAASRRPRRSVLQNARLRGATSSASRTPTSSATRWSAQDPRPGDEADEGSTVTLTVSAGPGEASVPDVDGLTSEPRPRQQLRAAGFEPKVEEAALRRRRRRAAWSTTSPPAGTPVERGTHGDARRLERPGAGRGARRGRRDRGRTRAARLEGAGLRVGKVTEQETETRSPARCSRRARPPGTRSPKARRSTLTVAKAPPEVDVPDVVDQDEDEATPSARGRRLRGPRARADRDRPAQDGDGARARRPAAGERAPAGLARHDHRRAASATATPTPDGRRRDPDGRPVRVAVLAGGRSSEHEVSLSSGRVRARGGRGGRARGRAGHDRALAARGRTTARRWRCRPAAGCSAPTPCSRCCTARSARTAPCRACSSCSTCPYVGAGVLASALCMDKVVFKEVLAAAGRAAGRLRGGARAPLARRARRGARRARRARHAGVRQAGAARLVGRDRQGVGARPTSTRRSRRAFAHDALVIVEAFSHGHGGRVLGARPRRARGVGARRDRRAQGRLVRLRGQVHATAAWSSSCPRGCPTR